MDFGYTHHSCKSAKRNMLSVEEHPDVVDRYLAKEIQQGRSFGMLPNPAGSRQPFWGYPRTPPARGIAIDCQLVVHTRS